MYVRLAFAVAAHLEPEILIIDEVLAVGDASFQKKSLGKMQSVAVNENRTVLFVSHSLQAVQSLCDRAILLNSGTVEAYGASRAVVGQYLRHAQSPGGEKVWPEQAAPGNDAVSLLAVRIIGDGGEIGRSVDTDKDFFVELEFIARRLDKSLCVGFDLANSDGVTVLRSYQTDSREANWPADPDRAQSLALQNSSRIAQRRQLSRESANFNSQSWLGSCTRMQSLNFGSI